MILLPTTPVRRQRAIINESDRMTYIKAKKGEHTHSSGILKKHVKSYKRQTVYNAAKNPTFTPHKFLLAASSSLSNMITMRVVIYREKQGVGDRLTSTPEDLCNLDPCYCRL